MTNWPLHAEDREGGMGSSEQSSKSSLSDASKRELKPIGIINEHNTCFLNSTFQALSATRPLISLLSQDPSSSLRPLPSLPPPILSASNLPVFHPLANEPDLYPLLPITRAFLSSLQKAWSLKDAGGGTSGIHEMDPGRNMSLKPLLRAISSKYDQYDDVSQQDAQELLRHLLDSMEMEEKDVIKKLQEKSGSIPINDITQGKHKRKVIPGSITTSPIQSPLPSPEGSGQNSPLGTEQPFFSTMSELKEENQRLLRAPDMMNGFSIGQGRKQPGDSSGGGRVEMGEGEKSLTPFVDALLGGYLASIIVCEKCKGVSHTYEGFLDISLSLKSDDPKPRKRDRFRAAFGFGHKHPTTHQLGGHGDSFSVSLPKAVVSDTELSDSERVRFNLDDRRRSLDHVDRPESGQLGRSGSKTFGGLKPKTSFSFRKKDKLRPGTSNSVITSPTPEIISPQYHTVPPPSNPSNSPPLKPQGPTPAQAAYIARILTPPRGSEHADPLARLRAAHNGEHVIPPESGLIDALRDFTAVEVLEGENAFACKKCWKLKKVLSKRRSGRHEATVPEEDERLLELSPIISTSRLPPPAISILSSPSFSDESLPVGSVSISNTSDFIGRSKSLSSQGSKLLRSPSPLRKHYEVSTNPIPKTASPDPSDLSITSNNSITPVTSITSNSSIPLRTSISSSNPNRRPSDDPSLVRTQTVDTTDADSDGLSCSDFSSDEETITTAAIPLISPGLKPKLPGKKKSSHYVMRRAFKRYLIATAPEVLVFHWKRFKQTHKGSMFYSFTDLKKVDDFISFPPKLDLAPFLAPNRSDYKIVQTTAGPRAPYMDWTLEAGPKLEPVMYKLYAVVVHLGTMIGGHYIAYCLVDPDKMFSSKSDEPPIDDLNSLSVSSTPQNGSIIKEDNRIWCYCSDTEIRRAEEAEVLASSAYLCFYEKI
ncbi:hypothetical protein M231_04087 [Tremella mesenterica]|uniref:ubiquitinyl hydrolase 1 n=1 Tax=Tremella mesenterica TaxID=5217 RepID=A0A4Q1BLB1_TREME|nr:hypothetical protein M231_04087 [Tremella mesenterica]